MKVIVSTGALVLGFALNSATALAQNIQGPAAPNFGLTSSPQTGATTNAAPNAGFQSSHVGGFGSPTFYRAAFTAAAGLQPSKSIYRAAIA